VYLARSRLSRPVKSAQVALCSPDLRAGGWFGACCVLFKSPTSHVFCRSSNHWCVVSSPLRVRAMSAASMRRCAEEVYHVQVAWSFSFCFSRRIPRCDRDTHSQRAKVAAFRASAVGDTIAQRLCQQRPRACRSRHGWPRQRRCGKLDFFRRCGIWKHRHRLTGADRCGWCGQCRDTSSADKACRRQQEGARPQGQWRSCG